MALNKETLEWSILQRQLALKDDSSKSWTVYVRKILRKYNLPSAFELFEAPLEKSLFKRIVRDHIYSHWEEKLQNECNGKDSLKHVNISACGLNNVHPMYSKKITDPIFVQMTSIKVKLLTMRYPLGSSKMSKNSKCPICENDEETLEHFIIDCDIIECRKAVNLIRNTCFAAGFLMPPLTDASKDLYLNVLLDPSHVTLCEDLFLNINDIATKYLFSRHNIRCIKMGYSSQYKRLNMFKRRI